MIALLVLRLMFAPTLDRAGCLYDQFFDARRYYDDGSWSIELERWRICDRRAWRFEVDVFVFGTRQSEAAKDCKDAYQTLYSDGSVPCFFFSP